MLQLAREFPKPKSPEALAEVDCNMVSAVGISVA